AIAPDLFWRQGRGIDIYPSSEQAMDRALALLASFDDAQAMQDITASIAFAQHLHGCPRSVAAVGYCLGGRLALRSLFDTA
ncbi:dienelactone hydrolase family protein, partial [Vibrio cholerae O1]|nr:dienelactone hydrolase family protein [Vibrio cholerae O1]